MKNVGMRTRNEAIVSTECLELENFGSRNMGKPWRTLRATPNASAAAGSPLIAARLHGMPRGPPNAAVTIAPAATATMTYRAVNTDFFMRWLPRNCQA